MHHVKGNLQSGFVTGVHKFRQRETLSRSLQMSRLELLELQSCCRQLLLQLVRICSGGSINLSRCSVYRCTLRQLQLENLMRCLQFLQLCIGRR